MDIIKKEQLDHFRILLNSKLEQLLQYAEKTVIGMNYKTSSDKLQKITELTSYYSRHTILNSKW